MSYERPGSWKELQRGRDFYLRDGSVYSGDAIKNICETLPCGLQRVPTLQEWEDERHRNVALRAILRRVVRHLRNGGLRCTGSAGDAVYRDLSALMEST